MDDDDDDDDVAAAAASTPRFPVICCKSFLDANGIFTGTTGCGVGAGIGGR